MQPVYCKHPHSKGTAITIAPSLVRHRNSITKSAFGAFLLLLCFAFSLTFPCAVQAQTSRTVKYNVVENAPTNLLVSKGDEIEFSGVVNRVGEQSYFLQSNGQVLDQGTFLEKWILHFDTHRLRGAYTTLTLHVGVPGGSNALLSRLHVSVVDGIPFQLSPIPIDGKPLSKVPIRLIYPEDCKPQSVSLTVDGAKISAKMDAAGTVSIDASDDMIGTHTVAGQVVTADDQTFDLAPVKISVVGKVRLLPFPFGDTLDQVAVNGSVPIRVQIASGLDVASLVFKFDTGAVIEQRVPPYGTALWNPRGIAIGPHQFQIEAADKNGNKWHSAIYNFRVVRGESKNVPLASDKPKLVLPSGEKSPVRLIAPATEMELLQPATLSVQPDQGIKLKSVAYAINGKSLPTDPVEPLSAYWDMRSEWPGAYDVSAVVVAEDGHVYPAVHQIVQVPVRVTPLAIEEKIQVTESTRLLALTARFLSGVVPSSVDFLIDGKPIAVRDKAPFDTATVDVADLRTGAHYFAVRVLDATGAQYLSPSTIFDVINKPQDIARQKAIEVAKAEAEQRKHVAEYLRRKNIVGQSLGSGQRSGVIGRVHGLAVLVENGVPIRGQQLTISGEVRPGTGMTSLIANAEEDARVAAETAASYCKSKILQMGYQVEWSKIDLIVSYGENEIRNGGPSAGVADAVALISACLKKPIDGSVAITGAIGLHGEVDPVGGIRFKAGAALTDPAIQTLILPAHYASSDEILLLYAIDPNLFANKRVIVASNMEQVLRQSIIGYDRKLDEAEELIQKGIKTFLDGKDSDALSLFLQAQRLTPENLTIGAWIAAVRNNKK